MTTKQFIKYVVPLVVKRLQIHINNVKPSNNLMSMMEYEYHYNGNQNADKLVSTVMNNYDLNLINIRTLDNIFMDVIEDDIDSNSMILLQKLSGNKTVYEVLKHLIFNSFEVKEVLDKYINKLYNIANKAIESINSQEYIEQKTKEWFDKRANMISASTCGYLDSKRCKVQLSKEEELILEKANMIESKGFSGWSIPALRHGQQFEDLTGNIYDTVNNLTSVEYGILTDKYYSCIGASPDGIITNVLSNNVYSRFKMGRMREIKNPVSRVINEKIPNYYYYQMQQQMYVCNLPYCDFIQTKFNYPEKCNLEVFKCDTMTQDLLDNCNNWNDLELLLKDYLLINIKYDNIIYGGIFNELIMNEPIDNLDNVLLSLFKTEWNNISYFPLENINARGDLKGILYSFVRYNTKSDVDFKIEWLPITNSYNTVYENYNDILNNLKDKYLDDGYLLEDTHYWNLDDYKVIEVVYNEYMYKELVLPKLLSGWKLIEELRTLSCEEDKIALFKKAYPKTRKFKKVKPKIVYDLS